MLVQKLAWTLADKKHDYGKVEVVVVPPFTDLRSVQTLVDGDRLPIRYGAQDVSDARRRRLHRRDLGGDAGQARLLLRRGRALRAPRVPRRDRRAGQRQGPQGAGRRHDPDRLRRRGARGPPGRRARPVHAGPGRRLAGRASPPSRSPAWSSPTSRSGPSAPARWPPRTTRRRSARRSAARVARGRTATRRPTAYAILYGGSVKAANVGGIMAQGRRRRLPGRRRQPAGRRVRRDLPLLRHAGAVSRSTGRPGVVT